jgi:hypothetical protein
MYKNWRKSINNCIQIHHCSSRYTAVALLLPYCPLRSISGQSHVIGWHPPPRTVDESWLICVRRICRQFWLVLETGNVASEFLFRRHCHIVGMWVFWVQVKIFYCEPTVWWKDLKCGEHSTFIKRKWLRIFFRIFLWLLRIFAKFSECISLYGIFLKKGSMNLINNLPWALPN